LLHEPQWETENATFKDLPQKHLIRLLGVNKSPSASPHSILTSPSNAYTLSYLIEQQIAPKASNRFSKWKLSFLFALAAVAL
jgi:hypothetical protein